ncbi:MAG: acyltransferase family protein [Bacteroidaceae bacterium]|nr:acyltransferase family protein [Bacteroidaceae bacterium]
MYNGYMVYLHSWIYCFWLSVVFYASGWLLGHSVMKDGKTASSISLNPTDAFWIKKYKRLLVPYIVLNSLIYLPKGLLSQFVMRPYDISFEDYVYAMFHPFESPNGEYWFMPALIMIFYLFVLLAKMAVFVPERLRVLCYVVGVAACVWLYMLIGDDTLGRVFYYLIFFAAGYLSRKKGLLLQPMKYDVPVFFVSFALSLLSIRSDLEYGVFFVFYTTAGTVMAVALSSIYVRKGWKCIDHLFGTNMTIYLYHWFVQGTIWALYRYSGLEGEPYEFAHRLLAVVLGIYLPYLLYLFMKKYSSNAVVKVLRFISGEKI